MPKTNQPKPPDHCDVAAQALVGGVQDHQVVAVAGTAARNGHPHISVRVSRLLIYVEDRAALDSFLTAWRRAEQLADKVFPPVQDEFSRTEELAQRRFERTGRI